MSIDDFGAGFTSLAYLSSLAVGRAQARPHASSRASPAATGDRDLQLVRATIELGHALGLRVVAEGIEDDATLDLLTELGCDLAQGYFIGRPKPAHELAFGRSPAGTPLAAIASSNRDRRRRQLARTA